MPQRKFRMLLSTRNVQTTAYPRFIKEGIASLGGGCCAGRRNPLNGWRKENCPCPPGTNGSDARGWVEIFKNVNGPDCCKPSNRMIQNKAASSATQTAANGGIPYNVSGKIDRNYNYNYREYLKKRCRIADYDLKNGRQFVQNVAGNPQRGSQAPCCTTDCSPGSAATVLTYKRSNWGFRKQGAVDNDLYISKRTLDKLNICPCPPCICEQIVRGDPSGVPVVGDTITANPGGATGTVTSITSVGAGSSDFTIQLDDCTNPILITDNITFSGGSTITTITSVSGLLPQSCDEAPPPYRRRPPQDPAYNPKNYNKLSN